MSRVSGVPEVSGVSGVPEVSEVSGVSGVSGCPGCPVRAVGFGTGLFATYYGELVTHSLQMQQYRLSKLCDGSAVLTTSQLAVRSWSVFLDRTTGETPATTSHCTIAELGVGETSSCFSIDATCAAISAGSRVTTVSFRQFHRCHQRLNCWLRVCDLHGSLQSPMLQALHDHLD